MGLFYSWTVYLNQRKGRIIKERMIIASIKIDFREHMDHKSCFTRVGVNQHQAGLQLHSIEIIFNMQLNFEELIKHVDDFQIPTPCGDLCLKRFLGKYCVRNDWQGFSVSVQSELRDLKNPLWKKVK